MVRKRGSQPGNQNAFKHGFYSKIFARVEKADLEALLSQGLDDEIAMLRVATRRFFELATGCDDLVRAATALNALGLAASRLGDMLSLQDRLTGSQKDHLCETISTAILDLHKEMKIAL